MRKILLAVIVAAIVIISTQGCVQRYCCGQITYFYTCTKPGDTVYFTITGPASFVAQARADSFSFYQHQGYTCFQSQWGGPSWNATCVNGIIQKNRAERGGDSCFAGGGMCTSMFACE